MPPAVVPATLFLTAFLAAPLVVLGVFSLLTLERGEITGGLTLAVYQAILTDTFYWFLFFRTLVIACTVTSLCLLFGYPIAFLYTKASATWRRLILVAVAAPLLTSALVRTFGWMVILGGRGVVNTLLMDLGVISQPIRFLFTVHGVVIGMTQVLMPFMIVPLIAALESLPADVDDAAANLGATQWQRFWAITVPRSLPGISAGVSLVFVLAFTEFTVAMLMGGATFNVVSVFIFQTMTTLLDWGRGAAIASLLLATSLLLVTLFNIGIRRLAPWAFFNT